jgi:hypothetical protein
VATDGTTVVRAVGIIRVREPMKVEVCHTAKTKLDGAGAMKVSEYTDGGLPVLRVIAIKEGHKATDGISDVGVRTLADVH